MSNAKNQNALFKNLFSYSLLQLANNVLPIISIPIVVRIIGPDKYGVINFSTVVMSYFILLTNYGFDLTATRAIASNKDDLDARSEIFNNVLFAKIILFIASVLIFLVLLRFMPQLYNEKKVAVYSFLIVFSSVLTPTWLYQGMQELYNVSVFNFITKLIFTILVLFVVRHKEDYVWQPFMIGIAHILVGVCAFFWAIKRYKIRIYTVPLPKILRHLWNERTIFFSFVSINVYIYASTLILGFVQKSEDVAFFSASYRLVTIMHTIVTIPLGMVLFPVIGESFGISKEKGLEQIKTIIPFVVYLTIFMGFVVWLLSSFIIIIFYGEAFRPAIGVLRILCFLPVALGVSNLLGVQAMVNLKMDKEYTWIIVLGSIIGVGLNLWLAKAYSYIGGAWALFLTEIFIVLMMWIRLQQKGLSVFNLAYFRPAYITDTVSPYINSIKQKIAKKRDQQ